VSDSFQTLPALVDELLARFITKDFWVRADESIRPDAFVPPKDHNLSVTRHGGMPEETLWKIGHSVAEMISTKRRGILYGRADITTSDVVRQSLKVEAAPLPENVNHSHITGWPKDKPTQKHIAQRLAEAAKFVAEPQMPRLGQGP